MMSNAKKVFNVWFIVWLILAIILSGTMLLTGWKILASYVLAAFWVMPIRDWSYRFLVWGIDYLSSISTNFKDFINPKATLNTLLEPKKRQSNVGFYRFLKFTTLFLSVLLALLCLIFDETSFNIVFNKLHTIEFLFKGQIGYANILMYLLSDVACFIALYYIINKLLNEEYITSDTFDTKKFLKQILIVVIIILGKIIISGILLKLSFGNILDEMLLWSVIIGFVILSIFIANYIHKNFSNDKKKKDNDNTKTKTENNNNNSKDSDENVNNSTTNSDTSSTSSTNNDNVIDVPYVETSDPITDKTKYSQKTTTNNTTRRTKKTMSFADYVQGKNSADEDSACSDDSKCTT